MDIVFALLGLISAFCILLGLIKPGLVLRWGKKRTRLRAVGWYWLFMVIFFGLTGATAKNRQGVDSKQSTQQASKTNAQANYQIKNDTNTPNNQSSSIIKSKVLAFDRELYEYSNKTTPYLDMAKAAMSKVAYGNITLGGLYQKIDSCSKEIQNLSFGVRKIQIPSGLPDNITKILDQAKEASELAMIYQHEYLENIKEWLDNRKPSQEAKIQEASGNASAQTIRGFTLANEAKSLAGMTDKEIAEDLAARNKDPLNERVDQIGKEVELKPHKQKKK